MKVERPKPKAPPPAKDPNAPRPFASKRTATLLDMCVDQSVRNKKMADDLQAGRDKFRELVAELERRDVSYRAISAYHPDIPRNPSISRMMQKYKPPAPA